MADRLIGTDSTNPVLPALVVTATAADETLGTIDNRVIDVRAYGTVGDGVTNDAPALRAAAADAIAANRPLRGHKDDIYLVNSVDANSNFITLTEGLDIADLHIKIGTAVTDWNGVFGTATLLSAVDMSGLNIHDCTFDGNSSANAIGPSNPAARRYIVHAWNGVDIRIHDNQIKNWDARNLFLIDGRVDGIENIYIYNNVGKNIGGAYWHDHSAIFASADYVSCHNNQFEGVNLGSTTPSSAWSCYELHGRLVECHNNVSEFYFSFGPVVSLYTAQPGEDSRGYNYHDNIAIHSGAGFTIWPQVVGEPISDIHIHHNTIDLDIDRWPTAAIGTVASADYFPGIVSPAGHYGVGLIVGNSYVTRCYIDDNLFVWRDYSGTAHVNDCGLWWVHSSSQASSGPVDKHCSFSRNKVIGAPSAGVFIRWYFGICDWDICDNTFHNIGQSGFGANYQAGITILDTNSLTVTDHFAIDDLRVNGNKYIDDQATHTLSAGLLLAAGSSRVVSASFTSGSVEVTAAGITATDIRSNVESATAALAAADRIITSFRFSGINIIGFNLSGNASATVTENATLTGGNGNTRGVEVLDTTMRIADGTVIPHFNGQASGGVQHTAFTGHSAIVRGRSTGTPEAVQRADVGSQWARTDGGAGTSFYVKESGTGTTGWIAK